MWHSVIKEIHKVIFFFYALDFGLQHFFWFSISMNYSTWFFHASADYQGLTKSFCHGKIYCSSVTAKLVNMKIGIPWDNIKILPLNQRINIAGIDVTCFDANHCPGAIIILFEPSNGKVWCILPSLYTIIFIAMIFFSTWWSNCMFLHELGCLAYRRFSLLWWNDGDS